ncbi:hypothetical protein ABG067_007800 [Albugo candida]
MSRREQRSNTNRYQQNGAPLLPGEGVIDFNAPIQSSSQPRTTPGPSSSNVPPAPAQGNLTWTNMAITILLAVMLRTHMFLHNCTRVPLRELVWKHTRLYIMSELTRHVDLGAVHGELAQVYRNFCSRLQDDQVERKWNSMKTYYTLRRDRNRLTGNSASNLREWIYYDEVAKITEDDPSINPAYTIETMHMYETGFTIYRIEHDNEFTISTSGDVNRYPAFVPYGRQDQIQIEVIDAARFEFYGEHNYLDPEGVTSSSGEVPLHPLPADTDPNEEFISTAVPNPDDPVTPVAPFPLSNNGRNRTSAANTTATGAADGTTTTDDTAATAEATTGDTTDEPTQFERITALLEGNQAAFATSQQQMATFMGNHITEMRAISESNDRRQRRQERT